MRIKPTVGYHYVPTKMLKIQNTNNIKSFKDMKQQELSLITGGNTKWWGHWQDSFVVS